MGSPPLVILLTLFVLAPEGRSLCVCGYLYVYVEGNGVYVRVYMCVCVNGVAQLRRG